MRILLLRQVDPYAAGTEHDATHSRALRMWGMDGYCIRCPLGRRLTVLSTWCREV